MNNEVSRENQQCFYQQMFILSCKQWYSVDQIQIQGSNFLNQLQYRYKVKRKSYHTSYITTVYNVPYTTYSFSWFFFFVEFGKQTFTQRVKRLLSLSARLSKFSKSDCLTKDAESSSLTTTKFLICSHIIDLLSSHCLRDKLDAKVKKNSVRNI